MEEGRECKSSLVYYEQRKSLPVHCPLLEDTKLRVNSGVLAHFQHQLNPLYTAGGEEREGLKYQRELRVLMMALVLKNKRGSPACNP